MQTNPSFPRQARALRRAGPAVAVLILASLLATTTPARAGRLQTARARLASIERQIKQQEAAITAEHQRLDTLAADLVRNQAALQATTAQLVATQQRLAGTMARYRGLRDRLNGIARTAFEQGPGTTLQVLLGSASFADLMDRVQYLDSIQRANAAIADDVANHAAALSFTRHDLNVLSAKQAAQSTQLRSQQASVTAGLVQQQQQLTSLDAERRSAAKLVRLLSLPVDPGFTGAGVPFGRWAALFLSQIGAPVCQSNLVVMVSWEAAEGTAAAYNPLATTYYMPGSSVFNYAGVRNYPSLGVGLQATALTLRSGADTHGYGAILGDLAQCSPAGTSAAAINASDWCRGCSAGMYVLDWLPLVEADYARFAAM